MVLPVACSAFKKRLSAKKSLERISSFKCASHESSSVSISRARRSFCSCESFSTQLALLNLAAGTVVPDGGSVGLAAVKIEAVVTVDVAEEGGVSLFGTVGEDDGAAEALLPVAAEALVVVDGEGKNEVIDALALGFLAVALATSTALRFIGVAMI